MKKLVSAFLTILLACVLMPTSARARYLDPNIGRFQTMDTFEGSDDEPISLHKYLYCHADPVSNMDPSGQMTLAEQAVMAGWYGSRASYEAMRAPSYASGVSRAIAITEIIGAIYLSYLINDFAYERSGLANWVAQAQTVARTSARYRTLRLPTKIVPIPATLMPNIAAHIEARQVANPRLVVLTRADVGVNLVNRVRVLMGLGKAGTDSSGRKLSWDEYPFASTLEGGGRLVTVRPVPLREQFIQGGFIMGSYLFQNISPGQKLAVIVVP